MTPETKAFLNELADLLEKHGAEIDSIARLIPWEEDGHEVEIHVNEFITFGGDGLYPDSIRYRIAKDEG